MDQTFIATKLGTSQSAYSELEHGKVKITDTKLKQIAEILGVKPEVITNFNETVAFNSCTQSEYINTNNINPIDKITELYERLLSENELKINELKNVIEKMKQK